jgi:hypothetical protein
MQLPKRHHEHAVKRNRQPNKEECRGKKRAKKIIKTGQEHGSTSNSIGPRCPHECAMKRPKKKKGKSAI